MYEYIWLNSLRVMSNATVFAMQDSQLAFGQTNHDYYTDPYEYHMDQKATSSNKKKNKKQIRSRRGKRMKKKMKKKKK